MKIPFIKIKQKGEVFYLTKINASDLKKYVNFEFRDPYFEYSSNRDILTYNNYINKINKQGIQLKQNTKGIQRKLQIERINSIRGYLEENVSNFFPNSVILSLNTDESDIHFIENLEKNETGNMEISSDSYFNIIDGQHRLAGIFSSKEDIINNFDIPIVLLVDISVSNAVKIFLDINSNQKQVNKSLVYDLYEDIDNEDIEDIKKIHTICQKMYINPNSPLYRQIKMLGVGSGAISQAFFIDTIVENMKFLNIKSMSTQDLYNHLFSYFRAYQKVFPNDWPVKEGNNFSIEELDTYANNILIDQKSQLAKTTGFGGIMNAFRCIYEEAEYDYKKYYDIVKKLDKKIDWKKERGTGKSAQQALGKEIKKIVMSS